MFLKRKTFSASNSEKIAFLSSELIELLAVESKKLNMLLLGTLFQITTDSKKMFLITTTYENYIESSFFPVNKLLHD